MLSQSALSLQYVQVPVTATAAGAPVNPTSDVVQFAFKAGATNPTSGDWVAGSWDGTSTRGPGNAYIAQCLIGPGGTITLDVDTYTMWIKVTDSPEVPVIPVGLLQIT